MNSPEIYHFLGILLFLQVNVPFVLVHSSNERLLRDGEIDQTHYVELQNQLLQQSLTNRVMSELLDNESTSPLSLPPSRKPMSLPKK
jgi:hypothetical protein